MAFLLLLVMAGCTVLPLRLGDGSRLTPQPTGATPPPGGIPTQPVIRTEVPGTQAGDGGTSHPTGASMLRIWLPPEFDPEGNQPASAILKARLGQFASEHPDVKMEVRVKAQEGAGGLIDALVAANVAAPLSLPDLVLLPRPLLESAILKGLLYSYDGLTSIMDNPSWFDYARQLSLMQSSTYGIPFAGEALMLAYHPSMVETPPPNLEAALALGEVLLYPATDPQALFTLSIYISENGNLQDAQGRPALDESTLIKLLEFDQRASQAGVMPYWLTQYSEDQQVWEAFANTPYPMAVTWSSTYLRHKLNGQADLAGVSIPTGSGKPYTLATGWSWALSSSNPARRTLAVELAEYLADAKFLAECSQAAGYLPPREDALQYWQDTELRQVIQQISVSAGLMPPVDMLASLGPAFKQAVVDTLKALSDPQTAARAVISQINQP